MELTQSTELPLSPIVQKYLAPKQAPGVRRFIKICRPLEAGAVKVFAPDGKKIRMIPMPTPTQLPPKNHAAKISKNVKTLALAFHWHRLLESGRFNKADEIARSEGINPTMVRKALRLTLLAPSAIMHFISHPEMSLDALKREAIPLDWKRQEDMFSEISGKTTKKYRASWIKVAQPARTV